MEMWKKKGIFLCKFSLIMKLKLFLSLEILFCNITFYKNKVNSPVNLTNSSRQICPFFVHAFILKIIMHTLDIRYMIKSRGDNYVTQRNTKAAYESMGQNKRCKGNRRMFLC